jgi:predicted phage terminase large subunit-like protein
MSTPQIVDAVLRQNLGAFIQRSFHTIAPSGHYKHNWHIDAIAHHLMGVATGHVPRLIITMPPRHMKSISTSVAFPAWVLGHDPTTQIVCMSYAESLAIDFSLKTRMVMESDWYQRAFPGTVINPAKNTQLEFMSTQMGFRLATSVGGPLTGKGGNVLIIDDPHKADDTYSPVKRQQVLDWFQNTAATRLNDPETGSIVLVQQRFHQEDLAGALLELGTWTHLNLPAIADSHERIFIGPGKVHTREPGEALHPERMSLPTLERIRSEIGRTAFASQYQQQPAPDGGAIVQLEWFNYYDEPPDPDYDDVVIQSWDIAYTTKDASCYSVCITCRVQNYRIYVTDVFRIKLQSHELLRFIPEHAMRHKARHVVLETSGVGGSIWQQLRADQFQGPRTDLKYWSNCPTDDKVLRLIHQALLIEAGRVFLPREAPWLKGFLDEIRYFPNGKFDDQVDSLTQLLFFIRGWTPQPPPGLFTGYKPPTNDQGRRQPPGYFA